MSEHNYTRVVVGDVDVDKKRSPWGYVVLYVHKRSKDGKWKHFFRSLEEFNEFFILWHRLEKPYILELDDSSLDRAHWRAAQ